MNYATPSSRIDRWPLCLHFLNMFNSVSGARTIGTFDSDVFLKWMQELDVVPSNVIEEMLASPHPEDLDALSLEARELATWFRRFLEDYRGKQLPPIRAERLELLNRILERDIRIVQIDSRDGIEDRIAGSGLRSFSRRIWRSPGMLLLPIADDIAHLLCEQDFSNVCMCEATDCGVYFIKKIVDDSSGDRAPHLCKIHEATQSSVCRSGSSEWL